MTDRFISEPITPEFTSADRAPAGGNPSLPRRFTWRSETIDIAGIDKEWKDTAPCRNGSGERYRRRHWYDVRAADGRRFRLYFDRRAQAAKDRWWLFSESHGG